MELRQIFTGKMDFMDLLLLGDEQEDMVMKYLEGNVEESTEMQLKAMPLIHALFSEVNPIPVKAAMNLMGKEVGPLRMPLTEMEEEHKEALKKIMIEFGLEVK